MNVTLNVVRNAIHLNQHRLIRCMTYKLLKTSKRKQARDQRTAFKSKRWVFTTDWFKNRRCWALKLGFGGTKQIPCDMRKVGSEFFPNFSFRTLHPGVDMKGWRGWQGFYLDLQMCILKGHFSERPYCSNTESAVSKCSETMNGTLSSNHIFLSFCLKNYYDFLIYRSHWCIHASHYQGTTHFHHRAFNQANNEPLHPNPHPLWPAQHTGWHVACEETGLPKSF